MVSGVDDQLAPLFSLLLATPPSSHVDGRDEGTNGHCAGLGGPITKYTTPESCGTAGYAWSGGEAAFCADESGQAVAVNDTHPAAVRGIDTKETCEHTGNRWVAAAALAAAMAGGGRSDEPKEHVFSASDFGSAVAATVAELDDTDHQGNRGELGESGLG